ncbi:hypothetical protein NDU88_007576 [Pleurodeles waltl]|uniref:Uncharacterized protein n=1 Tax=Pleurodeles waltl TaxID=8319 RepID=A0AAV7RVG8_PLEWA|nr:hypothetical protein NDU88_007576 [Pleurodeles waltl]
MAAIAQRRDGRLLEVHGSRSPPMKRPSDYTTLAMRRSVIRTYRREMMWVHPPCGSGTELLHGTVTRHYSEGRRNI